MRLEIEKFIEKDEGYMRRTKIICTIGPASCSEEVMRELLLAGLNVARMNFSHGTHESHAEMIARFRKVRDELKLPAAVMLDTKGPEIRLGLFDEPVEVVPGQTYTFSTVETPGTAEKCFVNYAELPADVKSGDMLLVDDGDLSFRVEETTDTEHPRRAAQHAVPLRARQERSSLRHRAERRLRRGFVHAPRAGHH